MSAAAVWFGCFVLCQALGGLGELFDATSHDFGNVPRGSVNTHRFVLTNTTGSPVHVRGVSSSCKCATPTVLKDMAEPGEQAVIEVAYNSSTFTGERTMTIYVTFDSPSFETHSLRVRGYSRQDVVFNPSSIDFGVVAPGSSAQKSVKIEYAGQADWKIEEVIAPAGVEAKLTELYRRAGGAGYELQATLKPDVGIGNYSQAVQLKTNDPQTPILMAQVVANIEAPLVASPNALELGDVRVGEKVAKRLLIRGQKPFVIKSVGGVTAGVHIKATEGPRKVHVLSVEFQAEAPGKVDQSLRFRTDMGAEEILPVRLVANVMP